MSDDTPIARRLHVERLVARGGSMTLEEARSLVSRSSAAQPDTPLPFLYILLGAIAGFVTGWLVAVGTLA